MRKRGRWTLNALTLMSLLLCVATGAMWVRSGWTTDYAVFPQSPQRDYVLFSRHGWIRFVQADAPFRFKPSTAGYRTGGPPGEHQTIVARVLPLELPYGILLLIGGFLPTIRVVDRVLQFRPMRADLCPACRYDLTGNVSGVCPECGTRIEAMT